MGIEYLPSAGLLTGAVHGAKEAREENRRYIDICMLTQTCTWFTAHWSVYEERETDRETGRDREADRQTETEREREWDRQTEREWDRERERQTDNETDRQKDTDTEREKSFPPPPTHSLNSTSAHHCAKIIRPHNTHTHTHTHTHMYCIIIAQYTFITNYPPPPKKKKNKKREVNNYGRQWWRKVTDRKTGEQRMWAPWAGLA